MLDPEIHMRDMRYRLDSSIIALVLDAVSDTPRIVELQPGRIAQVKGAVRDSGLVDVEVNGQTFTVFYSDLQERSTVIRSQDVGCGGVTGDAGAYANHSAGRFARHRCCRRRAVLPIALLRR
jgi:hypothetical protein